MNICCWGLPKKIRRASAISMNFTSNWVYVFISHRVGSRDIAEDLTSEVFLKALANLHRSNGGAFPLPSA